jgi:hypothetical protein
MNPSKPTTNGVVAPPPTEQPQPPPDFAVLFTGTTDPLWAPGVGLMKHSFSVLPHS